MIVDAAKQAGANSLTRCYWLAATLACLQRLVVGFWPCDDAYIAFRFAYNQVHHGQLAFNPGDPVFGCTTLSYALLMAALNALGIPVPLASWGLTLAADIAVCLLLVKLASSIYRRPALGLVAVILWLTHPIIGLNAVSGMETSIFAALMLGVVQACSAGRFGLGLALIALMVWTRIDGVTAFPVWFYAWWKAGRPRPSIGGLAATGLLGAAYLAFTWMTYGTVVPQSAVAKAGNDPSSVAGMFIVAGSFAAAMGGLLSIWYWYVSPHLVLLSGLIRLLWRRTFVAPGEVLLVSMALCHAGMFVVAGRATAQLFPWYYVPFLTTILLPALNSTLELLRALQARWMPEHDRVLASAVLIVATGGLGLLSMIDSVQRHGSAWVGRYLTHVFLDNSERFARFIRALEIDTALLILFLVMIKLWRVDGRGDTGSRRPVDALLLGCLLGLTLAPLALNRAYIAQKYQRREASYLELGRWISSHVGPGEWIGAQEIGAVGWGALDRKIYDEMGLITPGAVGVARADWTPKLRPAIIVDVSTTRERQVYQGAAPAGYVAVVVGHNLVALREDLKPAWDRDPPKLK